VPLLVPALREMSMGRWEGLTAAEIKRREPERFAEWVVHFPFGPCGSTVAGRQWYTTAY